MRLKLSEWANLAEVVGAFAVLGVKSLPGMARYWRQRRSYLHSGFAEYVDQLLEMETPVTVDIYRNPGAESEPDQ